ncbi:copper resistance protein CopC [Promicromonospora sukumoe]|uniref:copper resistance protein CopC n=1 Tax=Promicromonospora sukumoe TaxID=88382 RepID=UPI0037C6784F
MHTHQMSLPPSAALTRRAAHRTSRRVLRVALAAVGLFLVAAPPATAHDQLRSSTPADGATTTGLPDQVTLVLSEAPLAAGAQLVLTTPEGDTVAAGAPAVEGNGATLTFPVTGQGPAGDYTAAWHVVSSDGHPIEGTFEFAVRATATAEPTKDVSEEARASATPSQDPPSSTPSVASTDLAGAPRPAEGRPADGRPADGRPANGGGTVDPILVVGVGVGVAVAVLVVVTFLTRRNHPAPDSADHTGSTGSTDSPDVSE